MTLKFRNLTITPNDPVACWGVEGCLTALERGNIEDWRKMAAAVRENPWGHVAADIEEAIDLVDPDLEATGHQFCVS